MANFTDCHGHEWSIVVTLGKTRKIDKELGISLTDFSQAEGIVNDIGVQIELAYLYAADQRAMEGVRTLDQWEDRLQDGASVRCCAAFLEAAALFFRNQGWTEMAEGWTEAAKTMKKMATGELEKTSGQKSQDSQQSSESPPTTGH